MKTIEAYNFMKEIIKNAKIKKYNVKNVRKAISNYISILESQECLKASGIIILNGINKRLENILSGDITIEEAFVESYGAYEELDERLNYSFNKSSSFDSCGSSMEVSCEGYQSKDDTYLDERQSRSCARERSIRNC